MAVAEAPSPAMVARRVAALMKESFPPGWQASEVAANAAGPGSDLSIEVVDPEGRRVLLGVEIKLTMERRDVPEVARQALGLASDSRMIPVVAARYLSPPTREALADLGASYLDATGNMRLVCDSPAFFVLRDGEDRDPWRQGRPRGTLKGEPAARVTRALLDYRREWRVRDLITASGASSGATYRVLDYLQREALVSKSGATYSVPDWERLLRAWAVDGSFASTTRSMAFIEPRGLETFLGRLREGWHFPYAATGSVAAQEWASYAPSRAAFIYVSSIQEAAESWGLRAISSAPNVILLEPATVGDVPFRNSHEGRAGYAIAAPAQVAVDLLNGPGRDPAEAENLIEWMTSHEGQWRRE